MESIKKTPKRETESRWSLIKKIFTWQRVLGIIAILTFIILIYDHIKTDSNEVDYTELIADKITTIQGSFHPDLINSELDSITCVSHLRSFQKSVLDICNVWVGLERELTFEDPVKYNSSPKGRLKMYSDGVQDINVKMQGVIMNIMMLKIETESLNPQSRYKINTDEFEYLTQLIKLKEKTSHNHLSKALQYVESNNLKKGMAEIDKMKHDADYYRFDDAFFKYCIEVNRCCEIMLKECGINL